jgi:hypothetical protein
MSSTTASRGPSIPTIFLGGLALFGALAGYLHWQQSQFAAPSAAEQLATRERPPQLADVRQAVRAMQLVTVTLDTQVTINARDESSWRGDVDATITVPVRLFYGTDFSLARVESLKLGPLVTAYLVRAPEPTRIATEVYPEHEESQVQTGWLRFRSIAGEYALGLARRSIGEEARRMVLRPEDAEMIRDHTRQRLTELVKAIAGEDVTVTVMFEDAAASTHVPAVPEVVAESVLGANP